MPPPSNLPMPSTAKKPAVFSSSTSNMRMSLSGPARGTNPAPPSTNPRQSMMRSQNTNQLLQSTSKLGKTPLKNSARRGSIWGGAAMAAPSSSQSLKDPRNLRDKAFQSKMRQDILLWLQDTEFNITMSVLRDVTVKDFREIFHHLVILIDPSHPFNPVGRFDDDFLMALKALKYPYMNQIDVKWLVSPAAMHSWPTLLGMLHWLVEIAKGRLHYLESGHLTLQDANSVPDEFDEPQQHRALACQFYNDAYGVFLAGSDLPEEQKQALEARYAKKNERVKMDLDEKIARLNAIKAELDKIKGSKAPIVKIRELNESLKDDRRKFLEVVNKFENRKQKLIEQIAEKKADLGIWTKNLEQLRGEQNKLSDVVKTQNLAPEEVIQMNTDHENLSRNLEELKHKTSEVLKTIMSLEVTVARRAAAAEEALDSYTNLLSSLGLFPPLLPPLDHIDLTLELNTAASTTQSLLSGEDIRKLVKPTLSSIAESNRTERASVETERIKLDNDLDQLTMECENIDERIVEMEKKVVGLNEQADDLRDAAQQESLVSSQEAARLERELAQARTNAMANGLGVKSRLQALQFSYREQVEKVNKLRDETVRAIIKNSNDVAVFKEEVSQHLKAIKEYADEN
ncbi:hypothetical protein FIBSPDRAFT_741803 [Athelia psychrophila]|uniref:Kinetochore protein NDC80 n=1 Tax=Athelia psychrophila TaxID=1759441 RepID=A0A166JGE7_9AGAM|nr:hypothetical protein FIBSPDRAFT_741803 [Fibularhizoctonia sp. CBS 109695]